MKANPLHHTCTWFDSELRDRALCFDWDVDPDTVEQLVPFPPYRTTKGRNTMAAVISDAIISSKMHPGIRTSYSRNNNWNAEKSRYYGKDLALTTVPEIVDRLVDSGVLVEHDKRPPTPFATGIQSSFLPSEHLKDIELQAVRRRRNELIRLKDKEGGYIDYKDTERTERDRRFVTKINRILEEADIELNSPNGIQEGDLIRFSEHSVIAADKSLYRVYNRGVWTMGGRFYGGFWQGVSKKDRAFFCINGQSVAEEDYSQIHPSMLYAMAGATKDGDAYDIPGWDRDLCKKAFNILINANGWTQCHNALMYKGMDYDEAAAFIEAVKAKHPKIREYFHSGLGIELQNFDSAMCRIVLDEMSIKRKIVCLPIHDSFIVPEDCRDELVEVMQMAWSKVMPTLANH
jgi:hypothetical protein